MNILPKKNWHVLKKENIFKVKADIAKAKAIEEDSLRKSDISNQETYLSILRNKSKSSNYNSIVKSKDDIHVSVSDPLHLLKPESNFEHETEKKETQEKYEKNIGLLTYLGQSVIDSRDKDELWWIKGNKSIDQLTEEKKRKEDILLKKNDPLETILFHQKSIDQFKLSRPSNGPKLKAFPKEDFIDKKKKSKKSKKRRHRSSSSDSDRKEKSKKKKDKEKKKLREERTEREKTEKQRAEVLSKNPYGGRLFPI